MSTTTPQPDHRTRPRKKRAPSFRDQQILLQYLDGRSQEELAAKHHVSQPRISQILQRVQKWRANVRPQEAGELTHQEQQRLDRWGTRQMHEGLYRRSLRDYDAAPKQLTTNKIKTDKDGHKILEETKRDILPPAGLLKIAQRAVQDLAKEADKPPPPPVQDPEEDRQRALWHMKDELLRLRWEAERDGKVPASREHQGDNFGHISLVEYWLAALVGDTEANLPDDVHLREGDSLGPLLGFYRQQKAERRRQNVASGWITPEQAAAADAREAAALGFAPAASNPYSPNVNEQPQVQAEPHFAAQAAAENPSPLAGNQPGPGDSPESAPGGTPGSDGVRAKETPQQRAHREAAEKAERRRLHMLRLEECREAQRKGLPTLFVFDPEDGPLPPRGGWFP